MNTIEWYKTTEEVPEIKAPEYYQERCVLIKRNGKKVYVGWYERATVRGKEVYRWKNRFNGIVDAPDYWAYLPEFIGDEDHSQY